MIILCCLRYCNSHKTITIGNQKLENCSWFKVLENSKTEKCYFHEHWTKNIEQRSVHWDSITIILRLSVILLPPHPPSLTYKSPNSPLATSSETQGQIVGVRESLNGRKNMAWRKVKNGEKSPWGQCLTRPVPNGCRRSGFWLVPEKHKFSGTNQKPEWQRPFGTGLIRRCPQGFFSLFFTFLRATFFRLFRLSLVPTICPWVSKDALATDTEVNNTLF